MKRFQDYIKESAPPGKKAEDWVKANKEEFKKRYGEGWEEKLYATAWALHNKGSI